MSSYPGRDDAASRQHLCVRQRTLNIEQRQLVIEANRSGSVSPVPRPVRRIVQTSYLYLASLPHLSQNKARTRI